MARKKIVRKLTEDLYEIEFSVSRDEEARKSGLYSPVYLRVDFRGATQERVRKDALATRIIRWQTEIKANWPTFISGKYPVEVGYYKKLFGASKEVSEEAAINTVINMPQEQKKALAALLLKG